MDLRCSLTAAALLTVSVCTVMAQGIDFEWSKTQMWGTRTGVTIPSADNVSEAIGYIKDGVYYSPNGRKFKGGATAAVARLMLDAQPAMAPVKQVIGYAPREMRRHRPECELSDMIVDRLMVKTAEVTGKKVDVGITNFGGIRVDMPQGDVALDDILSMLPFVNYLCYLEVKGKDLRYLFEQMAKTSVQVIGGARIVVRDRKLVSATIGGKPINDNAVYGVATIDFLLDGGDNISVSRNALSLTKTDVLIRDALMDYLLELKEEGKPIEYKTDGRVEVLK